MRSLRVVLIPFLAGLSLALLTLAPSAFAAPLKVACTGSSSMAGIGSSDGHHVADELGRALGPDFMVTNFGVAATTAIKAVPNAYASTPQMSEALAFNPDVVLFWFGGNDSWVDVWTTHSGEFKADYTSLVQEFQALPSHPKTFLIRLWVFQDGPAQLDVLDQEILPTIDEIALETGSTVIDYRTFIEPHPEWFDDGMHANDTGTVFIGSFFAEQVIAALNASADGGISDAGVTVDASGGASGDASTPTKDMADAASPASSAGSGGASGSSGTEGGTGGAGVSGAGSSGSDQPTKSDGGGCNIGHEASRGGYAVLLSSVLLMLARRRRSRRR